MRIVFAACSSLILLVACASSSEVTRRRGDVVQTGRRVSPAAYAWYMRGRHHERIQDWARAERDFRAALAHDPESGATWAALGRLACRSGLEKANRIFERGLRKADRISPIYEERGQCRLAYAGKNRNQVLSACEDLQEALRLEPTRRATSTAYAVCLKAAGRQKESSRVSRAAQLYFGRRPQTLGPRTLSHVDDALLSGDLGKAQDAALELMSPGTLAVRALLLGQTELAEEQGRFVLAASPSDPDAIVALLALRKDGIAMPDGLHGLSHPGLIVFFQVLSRHAPRPVSEHFFAEHISELAKSEDPLVSDFVSAWKSELRLPSEASTVEF